VIKIRKSKDRGHFDHGWLRTAHTFSFGDYFSAENMGFRTLRVINEDYVEPGKGFSTHSHRDMEIVTYVLEGSLEHKDSMGNASVIRPGEVQRMSAGTGVTHSEFNASDKEWVHLLQIWILPERKGIAPGYEQRHFPKEEKDGRWRLVASRDGVNGSVSFFQDSKIYAATLSVSQNLDYVNPAKRGSWLQVARGTLQLNGKPLEAGDGVSIEDHETLHLSDGQDAEVLLFDLS